MWYSRVMKRKANSWSAIQSNAPCCTMTESLTHLSVTVRPRLRLGRASGGCLRHELPKGHTGDPRASQRYTRFVIVNVRGKRWNLEFMERLPSGAAGECDDPSTPRKAIWVATQQKPSDILDTLIHELLHAALPDLCEETILETATDIAIVLTRLGAKLDLSDTRTKERS